MALSDHEQQLLDQLEQQLRNDDPGFASNISSAEADAGELGSLSASRMVVGVLGIVVGIAVALGGIWAGWWWIGIVGFALMVGGGFWALKTDSATTTPDTPGKAPTSPGTQSAKGGAPAGGNFMDRMEGRWERRQRGEE